MQPQPAEGVTPGALLVVVAPLHLLGKTSGAVVKSWGFHGGSMGKSMEIYMEIMVLLGYSHHHLEVDIIRPDTFWQPASK